LIAICKTIFFKTPACLRFLFSPALLIYRINLFLRADQWIVTGKEVHSREDLILVFTGTKENKNYLANLVFGNSYLDEYAGKKWPWQTSLKKGNKEIALMINEVPGYLRFILRGKPGFYIPCWVKGLVDISGDYFTIIKQHRNTETDILRVTRNGLYCETTNDPVHFEDFYRNMYLPFISKRYGNRAFYDNYETLKSGFKRGDLILVKKRGGEAIAGSLIMHGEKTARTYAMGVKDGNHEYVKLGALNALYYFSFVFLKERGYEKVDIGSSRAFLEDGALNYKKKWNPKIDRKYEGGFFVSVSKATRAVKEFLINNPFMYADKTGINGAIFVDNNQRFSQNDIIRLRKKYHISGMNPVCIYRFKPDDEVEGSNILRELEDTEAKPETRIQMDRELPCCLNTIMPEDSHLQ
jgi:hypothetical protein